jgi:hypothetical protein
MVLIGLVAGPAAADPPTEFTLDLYFDETNSPLPLTDPCTGESMGYFDLELVVRAHLGHPNNTVVGAKGYGTTGSGYVLSGGPDHRVEWDGGASFASTFSDMWTNPETGDKMHMRSVWVVKDGVPQVDILTSRCVGGPTIEPLS